jgi:hypothetical protein
MVPKERDGALIPTGEVTIYTQESRKKGNYN